MKLHHLGELQLLKEIRERFSPTSEKKDSGVIVGIGDDAAVFSCPEKKILVTTDMMVEGVHFDLNYTSAYQLGFKLVSVNVSDIYAMGGSPEYLFLNIAMQRELDEEFFREFFDGIAAANGIYGLRLLGGDISSSINDLTVSATVVGGTKNVIRRAGATVGDKIYVTGTMGDSACGLEILKRLAPAERGIIRSYGFGMMSKEEKPCDTLTLNINSSRTTLDFNTAEPLIMRHLMPVVRYPGRLINFATSMMDVSDGLFIDLNRICDESNVGARVYLDKIPVSYQMKQVSNILKLDLYTLAESGGEDYELLFTAPEEIALTAGIDNGINSEGVRITCIGEIISKERKAIAPDGKEYPLKTEGYQHFGS